MGLNVSNQELLDWYELLDFYGVGDDVLWRPEFAPHILEIKTKHPEFTYDQIIDQLQKDLK